MRSVYLDEAGISNPQQEPYLCVAGVIVHTDTQWQPIKEHFSSLVERFLPPDQRTGFVFHAKDIWHGNGVFDRNTWTGDRREVLHALCDTIQQFELPIVWGVARRETVRAALVEDRQTDVTSRSATNVSFMSSFADCIRTTEIWMKRYCGNERVNLILENNNDLRKFATGLFRHVKAGSLELIPQDVLYVDKIVDAPSFMEKQDSPPLQLADVCAFVLKRYWSGKKDVSDYMLKLLPSMFHGFDQEKLKELIESRPWEKSEQPPPAE